MHKFFLRRSWRLSVAVSLVLLSVGCKKGADEEPEPEGPPPTGTCQAVTVANGLSYAPATGVLSYSTNGGGLIEVTASGVITLRHNDYPGFRIELWGGLVDDGNGQPVYSNNHENLNGKHIKDRVGSRRSIIFPDGAKLTIVTEGAQGRLLEFSIYDGDIVHHVNPTCRTLEVSARNRAYVEYLDGHQADGETSAIEITDTGLIWVDIYQEDTPGTQVEQRTELGEIFSDQPGVVNDYYDDPDRGDT
jgi:hypothetical protein